ncbi:hypothetical protein [uncultured Roseibium sp.]|uniref:hypothetical protein n=1 Tax=uncultured Roseibium sp. TaxID=1936171 RepID=UPI00321765A5
MALVGVHSWDDPAQFLTDPQTITSLLSNAADFEVCAMDDDLDVLEARTGEDFSMRDKKALVLVLYGASFNLAHTLGNIAHWILTLPKEERLDVADQAWVDGNLEELLSICASPKYIYRMARKPVTVDGVKLAQNDTLRLQLLSINRGTAVGNLAFGHGLHRCVGAALSRRVFKSALPRLFQRFPDITLVPRGHRYFDMSQTIAMSSLPCRLSFASSSNRENT